MCSLVPVRKLDGIVSLVGPRSILDVGCGTERTTVYVHQRGFETLGVEASGIAIRRSERPDLILQHDLRFPIEVAEHIHPKFVGTLFRHSKIVALSAVPPGQGREDLRTRWYSFPPLHQWRCRRAALRASSSGGDKAIMGDRAFAERATKELHLG
jgi:hypothetical protein